MLDLIKANSSAECQAILKKHPNTKHKAEILAKMKREKASEIEFERRGGTAGVINRYLGNIAKAFKNYDGSTSSGSSSKYQI